MFAANDLPYKYVELDITEGGDALMQVVQQKTGEETIPQIYINAKLIGGFDKLMQILQNGDFYEVYEPEKYANWQWVWADLLRRGHRGMGCTHATSGDVRAAVG